MKKDIREIREKIIDLYLEGYSKMEISQRLNVKRKVVEEAIKHKNM